MGDGNDDGLARRALAVEYGTNGYARNKMWDHAAIPADQLILGLGTSLSIITQRGVV